MLTLSKERAQTSNLSYYFKKLDKDEQTKPQVSRRKKIVKSRSQ